MDTLQNKKYIGRPIPSLVGKKIVTGAAKYIDDLKEKDMLFLGFVRSTYPHAKVNVDVSRALKCEGVVMALTGVDVAKMMRPYPPFFRDMPGMKYAPTYPLAVDTVRYVGEAVAAVLADDVYSLYDALDEVIIEYDPLPIVSDLKTSLEGKTLLYPEWGDNVILKFEIKAGNVEEAFAQSDIIVEDEVKIHRHTAVPMEPRGYMAVFDKATGNLIYYAATQQPHSFRTLISEILGIPENKIRVIQPSVGGGFGIKTPLYPEEGLVPLLAILTGRPVKWVETRREHFVATGHARDQVHQFKVGAKRDGRVIVVQDKIYADFGAFSPTQGYAQLIVAAKYVTGPYMIHNLHVEGIGYSTNKTPYAPYRGFGKESACLVYERMMDLVAEELGLDNFEVRLKNLIPREAFPYKTATGAVYDSGDYKKLLLTVKDSINMKMLEDLRNAGRLVGLGIAVAIEPSGASIPNSLANGYDATTIRIDPSGKATVLTGITSSGTGNETAIAQVVADTIGLSIDDIEVVQGDTAICPYGLGTFSSRAAIVGASSAYLAAVELRKKILTIAAGILEVRPEDLEIHDGKIYVKGHEQHSLTIKEVAHKIYRNPYILNLQSEPGLEVTKYFLTPNVNHVPDENGNLNLYPVYPYAVHAAMVEIDSETGKIKVLDYVIASDCGTVLNKALVDGQIIGGLVQGFGGATMEEILYDESCIPQTITLYDYCVPSALEAPKVKIIHQETPSPFTLLGSKGVGESSTVGAYAAVLNAVQNALSWKVRVNKLPLKPDYILELIKNSS